jgi:hypothetical protein
MSQIKKIIDLTNIKYCIVNIIYNESNDIFTQINRYFNFYGEYKIISTDTILIEQDSEIFELNEKNNIKTNIEFENYSNNSSFFNFPKLIKNNNFQLICIDPELVDNKYINNYVVKFFGKYQQKINHDESFYCCTYKNINNDKIAFGITKQKYSSNKSSRYIIGFDSTILDFEDIKSIVKEIFVKK